MDDYDKSIDQLIRSIAELITLIKRISMVSELFGLSDFHRARLTEIRGALTDAANSRAIPRTVRVMAQEAVIRADAALLM